MRNTVNFYHYLYAILYLFQTKVARKNSDLNSKTCLVLSIILLINFSTIYFIVNLIFPTDVVKLEIKLNNISVFIILVLWASSNHLYFAFRDKYKKVLLDFDVDSKLRNPRYYYSGIIYIVFSWVLYSIMILIPK